jgi:plasmid stability protein
MISLLSSYTSDLGETMPTLIVRNIDEETKARLMSRASANGRSMEAEVREILRSVTREPSWVARWLELAPGLVGSELELPERSLPREAVWSADEAR